MRAKQDTEYVANTISCDSEANNNSEEEDIQENKEFNLYSMCQNVIFTNPFFIEMKLFQTPIWCLVDSGADISLINERLLRNVDYTPKNASNTSIKSACGNYMTLRSER